MMYTPAKIIIAQLMITATAVLASSHAKRLQLSSLLDKPGIQFDVERSAGVWYEVVRLPKAVVPACVNVTAPASSVNGSYTLQVDYINNSNQQWRPTRENLVFPWSTVTQNGVFQLNYGNDLFPVHIKFKLIQIEYGSLAVVVGYSFQSARPSLLKILSRQRQLTAPIVDRINHIADQYNVRSYITFVEQSNCNTAYSHSPAIMSFFSPLLGIFAIVLKLFLKMYWKI